MAFFSSADNLPLLPIKSIVSVAIDDIVKFSYVGAKDRYLKTLLFHVAFYFVQFCAALNGQTLAPFLTLDGLIEVQVLLPANVNVIRRLSNLSYLLNCRARVTQAALLVFFNSFKVVLR